MNNTNRNTPPTTTSQNICRIVLAGFMIVAGIGHLTFARTEFQAQVPDWIPMSKDLVVILSGIVEIGFGAALLFVKGYRMTIGWILAFFFIAVFPGNVHQYEKGIDAFSLDTDTKRLTRLFFQPVLICLALWSTGVLNKSKK